MKYNFTIKELEMISDALWVSSVDRVTDREKKQKLRSKVHNIILELKRPYFQETLKEIKEEDEWAQTKARLKRAGVIRE